MSYKPGNKLVLEIKDCKETNICEEERVYSMEGISSLFSEYALNKLDRLDSDYINEHFGELQDEAYEEGKKAGFQDGKVVGYEKCVIKAREVIDKIFGVHEKSLTPHERSQIFGTANIQYILTNCNIKEIATKIEAWEKAKAEIKVGDVVEINGSKALVISVTSKTNAVVVFSDGDAGDVDISLCKKTGRTIDIASVLGQIGGAV